MSVRRQSGSVGLSGSAVEPYTPANLTHRDLREALRTNTSNGDALKLIIKLLDDFPASLDHADLSTQLSDIGLFFRERLSKGEGESSRVEFPVEQGEWQIWRKYKKALKDFQDQRAPVLRAEFLDKYEELKGTVASGHASTLNDNDFIGLASDVAACSNKADSGVSAAYWSTIVPRIFEDGEADRALHRIGDLHQEFQWLTYNSRQDTKAWLWTWRVLKQMWLTHKQGSLSFPRLLRPLLEEVEVPFFNRANEAFDLIYTAHEVVLHKEVDVLISDYSAHALESITGKKGGTLQATNVVSEEAQRILHAYIHKKAPLDDNVVQMLRQVASVHAFHTSAEGGQLASPSRPTAGTKHYPVPSYISKRSAWDYVYYPFPETRALSVAHDQQIKRDLSEPGIQSDGLRASDLHNVPRRHVQLQASPWRSYQSNGALSVGARVLEYLFKYKLCGKKLPVRPTPRRPAGIVPRRLMQRPLVKQVTSPGIESTAKAKRSSRLSPMHDSTTRVSKPTSKVQLPKTKLRGGGGSDTKSWRSYWKPYQHRGIREFAKAINLDVDSKSKADWVVGEFLTKTQWSVPNAVAMYNAQEDPHAGVTKYTDSSVDQSLINDYGVGRADKIERFAAALGLNSKDRVVVDQRIVPELQDIQWRWEVAIARVHKARRLASQLFPDTPGSSDLVDENAQPEILHEDANDDLDDEPYEDLQGDDSVHEVIAAAANSRRRSAPLGLGANATGGVFRPLGTAFRPTEPVHRSSGGIIDSDSDGPVRDDDADSEISTDIEDESLNVGQLHRAAGGRSPGYAMGGYVNNPVTIEEDEEDDGVLRSFSSGLAASDKENQAPSPIRDHFDYVGGHETPPSIVRNRNSAKRKPSPYEIDYNQTMEEQISPTEAISQRRAAKGIHIQPTTAGIRDAITSIEANPGQRHSLSRDSLTGESNKENEEPPSGPVQELNGHDKCHPCPTYAGEYHHFCGKQCDILDLNGYKAGDCQTIQEFADYAEGNAAFWGGFTSDFEKIDAEFEHRSSGRVVHRNAQIHSLLQRIARGTVSMLPREVFLDDVSREWSDFEFPAESPKTAFDELSAALLAITDPSILERTNEQVLAAYERVWEALNSFLDLFYSRTALPEKASDRAIRGSRLRPFSRYRSHGGRLARMLSRLADLFKDNDGLDLPASTMTNHYIYHQYFATAHDDLLQIRRGLGETIREQEWEASPGFEFYQAQNIEPNDGLRDLILTVRGDLGRIIAFFNTGNPNKAGSTARLQWLLGSLRNIMYSNEVDEDEIAEATATKEVIDLSRKTPSGSPNSPRRGRRRGSGNKTKSPPKAVDQDTQTSPRANPSPRNSASKRKSPDDAAASPSKRSRAASNNAAATAAAAAPAAPTLPTERDYMDMVVPELKAECEHRNIDIDKKRPVKADYISALIEADKAGNTGMGVMNSWRVISGKTGPKKKNWNEYFTSKEKKIEKFGDRLVPE